MTVSDRTDTIRNHAVQLKLLQLQVKKDLNQQQLYQFSQLITQLSQGTFLDVETVQQFQERVTQCGQMIQTTVNAEAARTNMKRQIDAILLQLSEHLEFVRSGLNKKLEDSLYEPENNGSDVNFFSEEEVHDQLKGLDEVEAGEVKQLTIKAAEAVREQSLKIDEPKIDAETFKKTEPLAKLAPALSLKDAPPMQIVVQDMSVKSFDELVKPESIIDLLRRQNQILESLKGTDNLARQLLEQMKINNELVCKALDGGLKSQLQYAADVLGMYSAAFQQK